MEWKNVCFLHKIDYENKCITISGNTYELTTVDFPTIDPEHPYDLTEEEQHVLDGLVNAFVESDRLHRHMKFYMPAAVSISALIKIYYSMHVSL